MRMSQLQKPLKKKTMKTQPNNWYAMEQKSDAEGNSTSDAEIYIYDEIGGWGVTANDFIASLESLNEVETINLRVNSPGGSIIEGNVIFNALKRHAASVTVYIDGLAASMASVIAMAGDQIIMADNALLMIHNPWTVSIGDSEQLRKDADLMDKMKSAIVNAYGRSNYDADELTALMDDTTWLTADEALEAGFIDRIETGMKAAASLADMQAVAAKAETTLPIEKIVASLQSKHDEALETLNNENASNCDALAQSAMTISDLQNQVTDFNDRIQKMNTDHKAELEAAEAVTAQAVAAQAAEIFGRQTLESIAEPEGNDDASQVTAENFWTEYAEVGKRDGLEAKNVWYSKHKHLIGK